MARLPMGDEFQALKHASVLAEDRPKGPVSLNLIYFKSGGRLTAVPYTQLTVHTKREV